MMLGERRHPLNPANLQVPPWPLYDDTPPPSPFSLESALHSFLPPSDPYLSDGETDDPDLSDAYACDEFRMYEFKVRRCARGRSHDWTECPFAHPGEKARRRDPRKYHYSGTACSDFRKGSCKKGDTCEFAHGVFECWLHPARYRTQPCKDGINCRRRVCFFAHTPEQLRVLPQLACESPQSDSYDGSPLRRSKMVSSPPMSPTGESPPVSPSVRRLSMNELLLSLRQLQLSKAKSAPPNSWGLQHCLNGSGSGCVGVGLSSVPTTPTRMGLMMNAGFEGWEEPMERVESGRDLRAKIAEKLSRENPLEGYVTGSGAAPDVDWVSDLLN